MVTCSRGTIYRVPYKRKTLSGKKIKIKGRCIKDRGLPGKGKQLFTLKQGTLMGYHSFMSPIMRHRILNKVIKKNGLLTTERKLNAIKLLTRNTVPKDSRIFSADIKWIKSKRS